VHQEFQAARIIMHDIPFALTHRHPSDRLRHPSHRSLPMVRQRDIRSSARTRLRGWQGLLAFGGLVAALTGGLAVQADEFDPLIVYEEARALNDQWQVCAATFINGRLQANQTEERLAEQALDRCRARQDGLNRFLIKRIGGTSSSNVVALLREKYRSGLIAAITELRSRE